MKKVKYRVNDDFALNEIGDILDAYLILADYPYGLLYHPYKKGFCPSFEIGKFDEKNNCWTGQNIKCTTDYQTYINVNQKPLELERHIMKLLDNNK